jgi:hypothetical protein
MVALGLEPQIIILTQSKAPVSEVSTPCPSNMVKLKLERNSPLEIGCGLVTRINAILLKSIKMRFFSYLDVASVESILRMANFR